MNARGERWAAFAALGAAPPFLWLLVTVNHSTTVRPDPVWMGMALAVGVAGVLLGASRVTPRIRGCVLWLSCLPLAAIAHGSAAQPLWALMLALLVFGLVNWLGIPAQRALPWASGLPDIVLTELDVQRIRGLLSALPVTQRIAAAALERELTRARVVPSIAVPADVVTMNSRIRFQDLDSGQHHEAVLVYPGDADPARGCLSVLGPVGSALLGLRVGQAIEWPLQPGDVKRYRVLDVLYQPEAAGDFHL